MALRLVDSFQRENISQHKEHQGHEGNNLLSREPFPLCVLCALRGKKDYALK